MALKIRLARRGAKKRPFYHIVVADVHAARDGKYLEKLGTHNPLLSNDDDKRVVLDTERVKYWLGNGAQPTSRVARFLGEAGLIDKPTFTEKPQKSKPKAKAVMRAEEKAEKKAAAEEAAKEAAEAEKAAAEEAKNAPAEEAPAEEAKADESTEATAEEKPAEEAKADDAASEDEKKDA